MDPELRIPEEYLKGIAAVLRLDESQAEVLARVLEEAPLRFTQWQLAKAIRAKVPFLSSSDLHEVVDALYSLYVVRASAEVEPDQFATDVIDAIEEQIDGKLTADRAAVEGRLKRLLGVERISTAAKAKLVISEQQHALCEVRVLTDIRPVFGTTVDEEPKAYMLVHTLKIAYHQDSDLKEFFVAMDVDDLESLQSVLERARKKASVLRRVIEESRLPYLDVEN